MRDVIAVSIAPVVALGRSSVCDVLLTRPHCKNDQLAASQNDYVRRIFAVRTPFLFPAFRMICKLCPLHLEAQRCDERSRDVKIEAALQKPID